MCHHMVLLLLFPHCILTLSVTKNCSGNLAIVLLLDKDMAVMVDKGFRSNDLVPCKVYRPPFLSKKSQLSHGEVLVTQDIARLMIHVERTIRRIKSSHQENKLFDTSIPLTICGSINQLFAVAFLLTNYQNQITVLTSLSQSLWILVH